MGSSGGSTPNETPVPGQPKSPSDSSPPSASDDSAPTPPSSSACAADKPCIEADVTLTDGTQFHFAREAVMSKDVGVTSLRAMDSTMPFGIAIRFKPDALAEGQPYPSDLSSAVWMSIYRKHPTDEGKTRLSSAQHGTIVFTKTGASDAAGTFDDVAVVRNEPDDTANIKLTKGTFRAGPL